MFARQHGWFVAGAAAAILLGSARLLCSQEGITAQLDPSGAVEVRRGATLLAAFELNAHGPSWIHAPQKEGKAAVTDLPQQAGKQVVGTLAVQKTDGGAIQYTQTITTLRQGFRLEYDLAMSKAMKLNGLQFSINLPVENYLGQDVLITPQTGNARLVNLPKEQPATGRFQLWSGQGARVDVAKGTPNAITVELRAATDVVVQDLRQWEQPVFEIRLPAFSEDGGRELPAELRFHLDLIVTFAEPVRLTTPGQ